MSITYWRKAGLSWNKHNTVEVGWGVASSFGMNNKVWWTDWWSFLLDPVVGYFQRSLPPRSLDAFFFISQYVGDKSCVFLFLLPRTGCTLFRYHVVKKQEGASTLLTCDSWMFSLVLWLIRYVALVLKQFPLHWYRAFAKFLLLPDILYSRVEDGVREKAIYSRVFLFLPVSV